MAGSSPETMQQRARQEDEGAVVILGLMAATAVASLAAIAVELSGIRTHDAGAQAVRLLLAHYHRSWFFLHTVFAIHYCSRVLPRSG